MRVVLGAVLELVAPPVAAIADVAPGGGRGVVVGIHGVGGPGGRPGVGGGVPGAVPTIAGGRLNRGLPLSGDVTGAPGGGAGRRGQGPAGDQAAEPGGLLELLGQLAAEPADGLKPALVLGRPRVPVDLGL